MIVGWTGLPGASKTTSLADVAIEVLYRNKKFYESTGVLRKLQSNIKFSDAVHAEFPDQIEYWADVEQLTALTDCDVILDEATVYFDSRNWDNLSLDIRRWLRQHRKKGIEIYFTAQEFGEVDIAFRRLVTDLFYVTKLFGSRDLSATLPPPKYIYVFTMERPIDPIGYDEKTSKFSNLTVLPRFRLFTRKDTLVFDTRQEIKASKYPPLRHIERECGDPTCTFHKTIHA